MDHFIRCFTQTKKHTYTLSTVYVLQESFITIKSLRTVFTRMAPSLTNGGTTQLFGAHHSWKLALAHIMLHFGKARPCPVV